MQILHVCTYPLLVREAHNVHSLHSFIIHLIVLVAGDLHVAGHQEAVIVEALQQQLLW